MRVSEEGIFGDAGESLLARFGCGVAERADGFPSEIRVYRSLRLIAKIGTLSGVAEVGEAFSRRVGSTLLRK